MRYFWSKFKKRIKALGQLVLVFGLAGLVLLYFLGYYDFTFIDRYVDQYRFLYEDSQRSPTSSLAETLASLIDLSDVTGEPSGSGTSGGGTEILNGEADESWKNATAYTSAAKVYDTANLKDEPASVHTVELLKQKGCRPADDTADYLPGKTTLGKVTFKFQLPEKYSLRKRTVERSTVLEGPDDTGYYVETSKKREERPAVETYMGYLLIDKGSDIYLLSSDGQPLCRYKANRYSPAYERDREGRPLFLRQGEDKTTYFYLAEGGTNFVTSDFDPIADSRGLKFDYPKDFGLSDSTVVYTDYSETYGLFAYLVKPVIEPEPEPEPEAAESAESAESSEPAEEKEEPQKEEPKPSPLTTYQFTHAYAFTSNRAAVTAKANRGGMFFINENGQPAFTTFRSYYNEYDRFVTENLMPPLTDGAESLGFYYFDHGLTRVRRQIYDWYNWNYRGLLRVVEDKNLLIRPDGTYYDLPAGYELEAYSEGMLMLSKNGKIGFMDYTGAWIAQPIFAEAEPFIQGLAVLTTDDGRKGMIDTEGNIVLPFAYDSLTSVSSGLIAAYREENGWTIYRLMEQPAESQ